ncbi:hypothetical protein WA026_014532 [Henosepilachna vigintioctopunctata]|uniref:Small ribosomal subunit protein uS5 n=1 Tax=Henosepilachna vigintioctopunctata TaxID=420089 RepID=A0AAW1UKF0_9CUCU
MADASPSGERGGRGFTRDRSRGRGRGSGHGKDDQKEWIPVTNLGRLVKDAKLFSVVPVRRGLRANKIDKPHTVPCGVTGKCGSVTVRLTPAPRDTGIVSASASKKLLQMTSIQDCYTTARDAALYQVDNS